MPSCKSGCDKADGVKRNEHQEQHEGLPQKLDLSKVFRNLSDGKSDTEQQPVHESAPPPRHCKVLGQPKADLQHEEKPENLRIAHAKSCKFYIRVCTYIYIYI